MFRFCKRECNPCNVEQVTEPEVTNCVEKEFYHEIEHICPIHTHVINKHIYTHTYVPQYTCSEENQVCNMEVPKCNGFMDNK